MNAILIELFTPIIPLLLHMREKERRQEQTGKPLDWFIRYLFYALCNVLAVALLMLFLGSADLTLAEKFDRSPSFALKFLLLETLIIGMITLVDQILLRYHVVLQVTDARIKTLYTRILAPSLLPLLAVAVFCLNGSLIFDPVLWGDEAFSVNTAVNNIGGIMEILHYWDSHPPLYYLWLHLLIRLLGNEGFVYHLSAFLPFAAGILLAVTGLRKHFGAVPAALFVIISGLASPCLEYNQEVRMYALTFLCLALCYYCSYLVLKGSKAAWFFMVLFGLAAAYSHYFGLPAAGLLLFFTGAAHFIRRRGKSWVPGLLSVFCFLLGYLPWFPQLLFSAEMESNWWLTELLPLRDALTVITGGETMWKILLPLLLLLFIQILILDCGFIRLDIQKPEPGTDKGHLRIRLCAPSLGNWTVLTYSAAIGVLTVAGTLLFAYLLCFLTSPVLAQRYLYPLCAVFAMALVIACGRIREWLSNSCPTPFRRPLSLTGRCCLLAVCCVLLATGLRNYQSYRFTVETEKNKTVETLSLIGDPAPEVPMAVSGVKHLSWTVLQHYYPGREILNESYENVDADAFWYFSGQPLSGEQLAQMTDRGYQIIGAYGEHSISQYAFTLYYFER